MLSSWNDHGSQSGYDVSVGVNSFQKPILRIQHATIYRLPTGLIKRPPLVLDTFLATYPRPSSVRPIDGNFLPQGSLRFDGSNSGKVAQTPQVYRPGLGLLKLPG